MILPMRRPVTPPTRGFIPIRDVPVILWFASVLGAVIVSVVSPGTLRMPTWLLLHMLFLGAATHAILVWSQHFTAALTRSPATRSEQRHQHARLLAANLGALCVVVGVPLRAWPLVASGVALIITVAIWHGVTIFRKLRGSLPGRFSGTVRYYILSAACLPVGSFLGAWIAHPDGASGNLTLAHALVNLLGWIGVTVAGTLVTLWPTMLRTKASEHAAKHAASALPLLGAGVLVAAAGAVATLPILLAAGLTVYTAGIGIIAVSLIRESIQKAPRYIATLSAGAALLWWGGSLIALIISAIMATFSATPSSAPGSLIPVHMMVDRLLPVLAIGFVAQILVGAMSYLIPVITGGGPKAVKVGNAILNSWGVARVIAANLGLLLYVFASELPLWNAPAWVEPVALVITIAALGSFIPILVTAIMRQLRVKHSLTSEA